MTHFCLLAMVLCNYYLASQLEESLRNVPFAFPSKTAGPGLSGTLWDQLQQFQSACLQNSEVFLMAQPGGFACELRHFCLFPNTDNATSQINTWRYSSVAKNHAKLTKESPCYSHWSYDAVLIFI